MQLDKRLSLAKIFRVPVAIALFTLAGLLGALVYDGLIERLSVVAVASGAVVLFWVLLVRRR